LIDNATLYSIAVGYYANVASVLFLLILYKIYSTKYPERDMFKIDRYLRSVATSNFDPKSGRALIICSIIPFALMILNFVKGYGVIKYFSDCPNNSFIDFLIDFRNHQMKHPDAISLYYPKYK
jgi:hypothetical protein